MYVTCRHSSPAFGIGALTLLFSVLLLSCSPEGEYSAVVGFPSSGAYGSYQDEPRPRLHNFELATQAYPVSFDVQPRTATITVDGTTLGHHSALLPLGRHSVRIEAEGRFPVVQTVMVFGESRFPFHLRSYDSIHRYVGQYTTGHWPKQVIFDPNGTKLIVPLLEGQGFEVIDIATKRRRLVEVEGYAAARNFVEAAFTPDGHHLVVSQMSTSSIHVFDASTSQRVTTVPTGGQWAKVVAFNPKGTLLAVSNWLSDDVTLMRWPDLSTVALLRSDGTTPRGLAFTEDAVIVAYFGSGDIGKFSLETNAIVDVVHTGGANRHVVVTSDGTTAFVSNMHTNRIYRLDVSSFTLDRSVTVGVNPNTIALSPDGRFLYVSCRGPNNPTDYRLPSPRNGSVWVLDTDTLAVVEVLPGGNQPTGLAISSDGRYLAFTNFQDDTVDLYEIGDAP